MELTGTMLQPRFSEGPLRGVPAWRALADHVASHYPVTLHPSTSHDTLQVLLLFVSHAPVTINSPKPTTPAKLDAIFFSVNNHFIISMTKRKNKPLVLILWNKIYWDVLSLTKSPVALFSNVEIPMCRNEPHEACKNKISKSGLS